MVLTRLKNHPRFINVRKSGQNILFDYDRGSMGLSDIKRYHKNLRLRPNGIFEVGVKYQGYKRLVYFSLYRFLYNTNLIEELNILLSRKDPDQLITEATSKF